MSKYINVLFFDDEVHNLNAFRATFRRHFTIYTTLDLGSAKEILNSHDIHVVLADQRMPEVSGVEFLRYTQREHPRVIRVLITAYSEIDSVIDAINKGGVYRYISKPWDEDKVIEVIKSAYGEYKKIEKVVADKDDVSLLAEMTNDYIHVLQESRETDSHAQVVEKVNSMVHLSQGILAFYALEDSKNNLSVGTTKAKRLSFKDYAALIRIHDIKVILSNMPIEKYNDRRAVNFHMFLQAATGFSSIKILPDTGKRMLRERIQALQ